MARQNRQRGGVVSEPNVRQRRLQAAFLSSSQLRVWHVIVTEGISRYCRTSRIHGASVRASSPWVESFSVQVCDHAAVYTENSRPIAWPQTTGRLLEARCSMKHSTIVFRSGWAMGISVDNNHITAGHELPAAAAPRGVVAIDRLPFVLIVGLPLEQQSYEM